MLQGLLRRDLMAADRRSYWLKQYIGNAQAEVSRIVQANPSLRAELPDIMATAFQDAHRASVIMAMIEEVDPDLVPATCPYSLNDVMTPIG